MDLFEREEEIFAKATEYAEKLGEDTVCRAEYEKLLLEYGRLLKHLRRITVMADKTAVDLHSTNVNLREKVDYDGLTGIFNRRFVEEHLPKMLSEIEQSKDPHIGVMMLDVDFFKDYNDYYGHVMGDECLRSIATTLQGSLRQDGGFVARYGGEEFVIVVPHATEREMRAIGNRVLKNVEELKIPHSESDVSRYVTISVGAAVGEATTEKGHEVYLERADKALYCSKRDGRNMYTFLFMEEDT